MVSEVVALRPMSSLPPAIAAAYSPERLREDGHRLVDALATQLTQWQRREGKVLPWHPPAEARTQWPIEPGADLVDDLRRVMASSTALYHPRVMAHQVPPPLPGAALAEL